MHFPKITLIMAIILLVQEQLFTALSLELCLHGPCHRAQAQLPAVIFIFDTASTSKPLTFIVKSIYAMVINVIPMS